MIGRSRVFVIVPAYEEAPRIARVVASMPAIVDRILVVDDASTDGTGRVARSTGDVRVRVVEHPTNRGVGATIVTGYRAALDEPGGAYDAFVVMAGDGQMDPADLPRLVAPIERDECDYAKGDRMSDPSILRTMPLGRYVGGRFFSALTSLAIGVRVSDSQCGYTALAREACVRLDLDALYPRYGYPNDLLGQLARKKLRIRDVPVRPVYADEVSRLKLTHLPTIAGLIGRAWAKRVFS
jgi:glycosyltransferase involved in cell wall biosynthesis